MNGETVAGRRLLFTMATDHEHGVALRARIKPLITGVGPVEAAIATSLRLERMNAGAFAPTWVVCHGSAGSRRCRLGEVYQINRVSWRDMDASAIGFPLGVTPFTGHPAEMTLATPLSDVPRASLSTGANIVSGADFERIAADLVDMETFAVLRACQHFDIQ